MLNSREGVRKILTNNLSMLWIGFWMNLWIFFQSSSFISIWRLYSYSIIFNGFFILTAIYIRILLITRRVSTEKIASICICSYWFIHYLFTFSLHTLPDYKIEMEGNWIMIICYSTDQLFVVFWFVVFCLDSCWW